jgi:hypothetical protein
MPTISKDNNCVTLINIFTVEPAKQQQLIDLLIRATTTTVGHVQGSFPPVFTAVSMEPRSPFMPSGAVRRTTRPCAAILPLRRTWSRRWRLPGSSRECTRSWRFCPSQPATLNARAAASRPHIRPITKFTRHTNLKEKGITGMPIDRVDGPQLTRYLSHDASDLGCLRR